VQDPTGAPDATTAGAPGELAQALDELREIGAGARRLADLLVERARVGLRNSVFRLVLGAWLVLVVVTITVSAAVAVVAGLRGAIGGAAGSPWVGDLAGGGLVLGAVWAAAVTVRGQLSRRNSRRLALKYPAGAELARRSVDDRNGAAG
jgi:hypothetical protein